MPWTEDTSHTNIANIKIFNMIYKHQESRILRCFSKLVMNVLNSSVHVQLFTTL